MINLPKIPKSKNDYTRDIAESPGLKRPIFHSNSLNEKNLYYIPDKYNYSRGKTPPRVRLNPINRGNTSFDAAYDYKSYSPLLQPSKQSLNDRVGADYFYNYALGSQAKEKSNKSLNYGTAQSNLLQNSRTQLGKAELRTESKSPLLARPLKESRVKTILRDSDEYEPVKYHEDAIVDFNEIAAEFYQKYSSTSDIDSKKPIIFKELFLRKYDKNNPETSPT
jgi:hypothetical protein